MKAHHPERPVDDGPPPVLWSDYEESLKGSYRDLLAADPTESDMQAFFERNPALMPGAFPDQVGHGAFPNALISQPELSGIGERRPDFMWIARNSAMVQPVLIEIESPRKRWVAGKGKEAQQSANFTQAMNQLRRWQEWLAKPPNQEVLPERFKRRRGREIEDGTPAFSWPQGFLAVSRVAAGDDGQSSRPSARAAGIKLAAILPHASSSPSGWKTVACLRAFTSTTGMSPRTFSGSYVLARRCRQEGLRNPRVPLVT